MVVGTGLTTSVSLWLSWFWVHTGHFSQVFWLQLTCAPCVCGSGNRSSTHFLCLVLIRVIYTLSSSGFGDGWSTYFGDGCSAQFLCRALVTDDLHAFWLWWRVSDALWLWWRVIYTLSGFGDGWSTHFLWLALLTSDLYIFFGWLWWRKIYTVSGFGYSSSAPIFWLHLLVTHTPSSGSPWYNRHGWLGGKNRVHFRF